jgi:hypothetical protein
MSDVQDTHRQAMEQADQADAAKKAGDLEEARTLFVEASRLESEAAHALIDQPDAEPTRSVLFRSAASLAMEARQFGQAAYLVACGLEGAPPQEIREELRALLRTVRHEVERDRGGRFIGGYAHLQAAADRVRTALADSGLSGRALAGSVTRKILDSAQDSLRASTGDTAVSVDLLGVGGAQITQWVSVSPRGLPLDWRQFGAIVALEHGDALLQAVPIVTPIEQLANTGALAEDEVRFAQDVGIRALAAYPVRAIDENQADRPAFVLLALASQETAFADQRTCQILAECVSLLEIAIQIGWRDEILRLRSSRLQEDR